MHLTPIFLRGGQGAIFALLRSPENVSVSKNKHCLIIVPPFADEMNKSRHMFSLLANKLCENGCASLIFDPYGTGDSEGDFADANWDVWMGDLSRSIEWAKENGFSSFTFLGLRAGALLAAEYIAFNSQDIKQLLLWAPIRTGYSYLRYFMRLSLGANILSKNTQNDRSNDYGKKNSLNIGGYVLSKKLIEQLEKKNLIDVVAKFSIPVYWIDIHTIAPKVAKNDAGLPQNVSKTMIVAPPFWLANEICEISELVDMSVDVVMR